MLIILILVLIGSSFAAESVTITEPVDGASYDDIWVTVRTLVENDNELPDSVHYSLNGQPVIQIPRLNTDWYTYMQNDLHDGYSESPAPTDNTVLWTAQVTGDIHEFPTPVIVDGIVYYPSDSGTDYLYALDAATGEIIWQYLVGYTDDAVTVKNGYLYTASDSLWCLDALTGDRIWATAQADASGSTPAVIDGMVYAGRNVGFPAYMTWITCFDAMTGHPLWAFSFSGLAISCLTVWNGMVFVPTYKSGVHSPLYALDANTGVIQWTNNDANGYWDSSPVVVEGVIYISSTDGRTRAIDAVSGATIWEVDITLGGMDITATPAYHNSRLYFADQVDTFHCLDASTGSTIWSAPGKQHGSSGIADGIVFFGDMLSWPLNARVVALDCDTGEEIWSYITGSPAIFSSPAITDGVVYIAGMDWNLYAFGTGLKYTYLDSLSAQAGTNELIVTSFDEDVAIAADTIRFEVTGLAPSSGLSLSVCPNPFSSDLNISFILPEPTTVELSVYDLSGRLVEQLVSGSNAGDVTLVWNSYVPLPAGCYLIVLDACGERAVRRCVKLD